MTDEVFAVARVAVAAAVIALFAASMILRLRASRGVPALRRWAALLFPLSQLAVLAFLFAFMVDRAVPLWVFLVSVGVGAMCLVADRALFKALAVAEEKEAEEERVALLQDQLALQEAHRAQVLSDARAAWEVFDGIERELDAVEEALRAAGKGAAPGAAAACGEGRAQEALDRLRRAVDRANPPRRFCEHRVVDALMGSKARACEEAGIRTVFDLALPDDLALPGVDLCAVMSNLMDNALRSCAEVPADLRFIELRARVAGGYVLVHLRNACLGERGGEGPQGKGRGFGRHGAEPSRTGFRMPEHGWGLLIVQDAVRRYDGSLTTERHGGVFLTSAALKLDGPASSAAADAADAPSFGGGGSPVRKAAGLAGASDAKEAPCPLS